MLMHTRRGSSFYNNTRLASNKKQNMSLCSTWYEILVASIRQSWWSSEVSKLKILAIRTWANVKAMNVRPPNSTQSTRRKQCWPKWDKLGKNKVDFTPWYFSDISSGSKAPYKHECFTTRSVTRATLAVAHFGTQFRRQKWTRPFFLLWMHFIPNFESNFPQPTQNETLWSKLRVYSAAWRSCNMFRDMLTDKLIKYDKSCCESCQRAINQKNL